MVGWRGKKANPDSWPALPPFAPVSFRYALKGPKRNARNEKALEMFNHFKGLVVFNNGGEIGTLENHLLTPATTVLQGLKLV